MEKDLKIGQENDEVKQQSVTKELWQTSNLASKSHTTSLNQGDCLY